MTNELGSQRTVQSMSQHFVSGGKLASLSLFLYLFLAVFHCYFFLAILTYSFALSFFPSFLPATCHISHQILIKRQGVLRKVYRSQETQTSMDQMKPIYRCLYPISLKIKRIESTHDISLDFICFVYQCILRRRPYKQAYYLSKQISTKFV